MQNEKINKWVSWLGTVASILGSFTVSFQVFLWGYLLFMVGSISWLWVALKAKNRSLFVLNLFFLVANLIGLWKSW